MVVDDLPPMGRGHSPSTVGDGVRFIPKGFDYLAILNPRARDEVQRESREALRDVSMNMKLSYSPEYC